MSFTRLANRIAVWQYRRLDGRFFFGGKAQVVMLTIPGRRTGVPRPSCVASLKVDGGYLVWGTGSGSRTEPDWFRNLRAAETLDVQRGTERFVARPRVLDEPERSAAWQDQILVAAPRVEKFAAKAGRTIPVALLEPID